MRKMKNSKGFTLMEMLIVVAIIAVLVAIAIPTFATSLNKAKVAADKANIRSGYASVMATVLTADEGKVTTGDVYYLQKDGSAMKGSTDSDYTCQGKQEGETEIAGKKVESWTEGKKVTYTVTAKDDGWEVAIGISGGTTNGG